MVIPGEFIFVCFLFYLFLSLLTFVSFLFFVFVFRLRSWYLSSFKKKLSTIFSSMFFFVPLFYLFILTYFHFFLSLLYVGYSVVRNWCSCFGDSNGKFFNLNFRSI